MIDLELALRVSEVKRWTIVKLSRDQSLADHSYRVWLIARAIYEIAMPVAHNSSDAKLLEDLALTHDLHEVLTGDIPATLKMTAPHAISAIEDIARVQMRLPSLAAHANTAVWRVLKVADLAESLLFLYQNGGYADRRAVWDRVRSQYRHEYGKDSTSSYGRAIHQVVLSLAASDPGWAQAVGETP